MNIAKILFAVEYALRAHKDQKRKYTGENYVVHVLEVARIVAEFGGTEAMVIAAILHDVVEDTDKTIDDVRQHFGDEVADLVGWLTDVSKLDDGNREVRKAIDRAHSAEAPSEAQTVKCADLISNTRSIAEHDKNFAPIYLDEKYKLLQILEKADPRLLILAWRVYYQSRAKLAEANQADSNTA